MFLLRVLKGFADGPGASVERFSFTVLHAAPTMSS